MPTRKRKTRKMRGSMRCGYGGKKKHRGAGSRGGRGRAGLMKHKKSLMVKKFPNYFGRSGFKIPQKARKKGKSITLKDIDIITKKLGLKEINLSEYGYEKVLSTGKISQPLTIKAEKIVEKAKEKITAAGGQAIEGTVEGN